jgi:hypothetical protein
MNKKIMVVVLGLISILNIHAEKVEGTILFNNDSTAHVTFEIPVEIFLGEINYRSLQEKIVYYSSDDKKVILKPNQLKEILFKFNNEDIRMVSCINNPSSYVKHILLRIVLDGKLKLFIYHSTRGPVGMYVGPGSKWVGKSGDVELIVLKKNNEELFKPRFTDKNFKNDMRVYLSDCKSLVQKIENDLYNIDNIRQIVNDYNTNCAGKE